MIHLLYDPNSCPFGHIILIITDITEKWNTFFEKIQEKIRNLQIRCTFWAKTELKTEKSRGNSIDSYTVSLTD